MPFIVRSGALLGFPELVEALGQNPFELLDEIGLARGVLNDPDLYLPYRRVAALYELAARRCGATDFGLRLGGSQGLEVVGALGSWLCLQPTVGSALQLVHRNIGFHARGVSIDVHTDRAEVRLEMRLAFAEQQDCAQLLMLSMALLARAVAQMHGTRLLPLRAGLALPAPTDLRRWRKVFGVTPAFAAPVSHLVYPARLLELPIRIDAALRERLSTHWRAGWHRDQTVALPAQVRRAIGALLPTGDCSLEQVARVLDLGARSLQLRLQREGLSFGELLRQTRESLAREHLARSTIDLTTLALNLGFGELAVFSRAFKSWTGQSPRAWRAAQSGDDYAGAVSPESSV